MFMLDTDMCIYLINSRDDALREEFEKNAVAISISSISYAELCFRVAHSEQKERNTRELEEFCLDLDILPFGAAAGIHYGEIRQSLTPFDCSPCPQCGRDACYEQRSRVSARARVKDGELVGFGPRPHSRNLTIRCALLEVPLPHG